MAVAMRRPWQLAAESEISGPGKSYFVPLLWGKGLQEAAPTHSSDSLVGQHRIIRSCDYRPCAGKVCRGSDPVHD